LRIEARPEKLLVAARGGVLLEMLAEPGTAWNLPGERGLAHAVTGSGSLIPK